MKVFLQALFIFLIIFTSQCYSQNIKFYGTVKEADNGTPIPHSAVVLKKGESIIAYSYTNNSGFYSIEIKKQEVTNAILEVSSLGFRKQKREFTFSEGLDFNTNFLLVEEFQSLSEVVISPDKKIEIKRDTLIYKVSRFSDGTERTVEDVLEKIPGIEIDSDGNIKAQGKSIKKILIEGDDLADSNYKVISMNLDASVLDKVEVISDYDENPVLKQFLSSEAIVLNLKLKDKSKSIIFGTLEAGAGMENRFITDLNLGLIRPEVKFLNLGNWNNTGKPANELNNYVFDQSYFNKYDENFSLQIRPPVDLKSSTFLIEDKFYINNNTLSNNLLFNKTFKDNLKLRNSTFFFRDELNNENSGLFRYLIKPEEIVFTEDNIFDNKITNFTNEFEGSHSFSENDYLTFQKTLKYKKDNIVNKLLFNANEQVDQLLEDRNTDFDTHLKYTRKIKNGAAFFYGFLGSKELQQDFYILPNTLSENSSRKISFLHTASKARLNYQGLNTSFILKKNSFTYLISAKLLNLSERYNANTTAMEEEAFSDIDSLSGENLADSFKMGIELNTEYRINKQINLRSGVEAILNDYSNHQFSKKFLYLNRDINLDISKTSFGAFRFSYSHNYEIPDLLNFTEYNLIKNYRKIQKGSEIVRPTSKINYSFSYILSKPKKRLLFNTSLSFQEFKNQLMPINLLSETLTILDYEYASGQNFFSFRSGLTTYYEKISTSFKLGHNELVFVQPNIINGDKLLIRNRSRGFYLRGTTYWKGPYNLKFSIAYNISKNKLSGKEVTNNYTKMSLENTFKISKLFFGNLKNDVILIDSQLFESSTIEVEYRPKKSQWVYGIRGQNIFDTANYELNSLNDFQYSSTSFRSVSRYFLLYGRIRF